MRRIENKRQRISKGQSKMDNAEKLATQGTYDEGKQNKDTTLYVNKTCALLQTTGGKYEPSIGI